MNGKGLASVGAAILIGVVAVLALSGREDPAQAAAEAEALTEEGKRRLATGDAEGALQSFEAALEVTPGVPHLLYNAARAAEGARRVTEAEQRYREAIDALAPEEDWTYFHGLGNLLLRTERAAAAIEPLSRAVALHDAVPPHRSYQDALRAAGKWAKAEQLYADRMARRTGDVDALYLYARLVKEPAGRAGVLREALQRDPNHYWSRLALGGTLLETGDAGSALKEFQAAQALDPAGAKAWFGILRAHLALNDRPGAEAALGQLTERHPGSSTTRQAEKLVAAKQW